jgi:hypothetical protein
MSEWDWGGPTKDDAQGGKKEASDLSDLSNEDMIKAALAVYSVIFRAESSGNSISTRSIMKEAGLRSFSRLHDVLEFLESLHYIKREPGRYRGIRLGKNTNISRLTREKPPEEENKDWIVSR